MVLIERRAGNTTTTTTILCVGILSRRSREGRRKKTDEGLSTDRLSFRVSDERKSQSGLFVTQLANGIMSMPAHPSTLPHVMYHRPGQKHVCPPQRKIRVPILGPMVYAKNVGGIGSSGGGMVDGIQSLSSR